MEVNAIMYVTRKNDSYRTVRNDYEICDMLKFYIQMPRKPVTVLNSTIYSTTITDTAFGIEFFKLGVRQNLHNLPECGHTGPEKALARNTLNFYWKKLIHDDRDFMSSCDACQKKSPNHKPFRLLKPLEAPKEEWTRNTVHSTNLLPKYRNENSCYIVVEERPTKVVYAMLCAKDPYASKVAQLF